MVGFLNQQDFSKKFQAFLVSMQSDLNKFIKTPDTRSGIDASLEIIRKFYIQFEQSKIIFSTNLTLHNMIVQFLDTLVKNLLRLKQNKPIQPMGTGFVVMQKLLSDQAFMKKQAATPAEDSPKLEEGTCCICCSATGPFACTGDCHACCS